MYGSACPDFGPLAPLVLAALAVTFAAVLVSGAVAAFVSGCLARMGARRRLDARAVEAGWIAGLAQRWFRSPADLGGPDHPEDGYRGLTYAALGLAADTRHPDVHRTTVGVYRLVPVAPCATLDECARLVGTCRPAAGGLLVVGTGGAPEEATAVLVLGPLVQVLLPAVPWPWIRALTTPATDPLAPVRRPTPQPAAIAVAPAVPAHARPQRERRLPSWRSPKPTTRRRERASARAAV